MHYMYHIVPNQMIGTSLYPLNQLKEINPSAYESAAAKYQADPAHNRRDRSALMRRHVPILDCLWNDVLHSSTVHPKDLMDMWHEAGYVPENPLIMFEIPLAMLDGERTLIYKHQCDYLKWMRWNYERYNPTTYEPYTRITEKAKATMRQLVVQKQIWHFLHIPHVLYRGEIEIKDVSVISVYP